MGGLLAVGSGSVNPPRMIVIRYQGTNQWENAVGLVGKGITFDTGGISLKRAPGMESMFSDMAGAAAVLAVMDALGHLRPKVNVVMLIPAAENMPKKGMLINQAISLLPSVEERSKSSILMRRDGSFWEMRLPMPGSGAHSGSLT